MEAIKQQSVIPHLMAASHATGKNAAAGFTHISPKSVVKPSPMPAFIQPKLKVNKPGDAFERESNDTADKVMRTRAGQNFASPSTDADRNHPEKPVHHTFSSDRSSPVISRLMTAQSSIALISSKCARCANEEKIHRKSHDEAHGPLGQTEQVLKSTKGGGHPLPPSTLAFMNRVMGADFSNVRIHTDSKAISMSRSLHAHAFTHGRDIYFNEGTYDPGSASGKHLLAHELTHVVQQGYAAPLSRAAVVTPGQASSIQRLDQSDPNTSNTLNESIDFLVKRYMPELFDIKKVGGIVPWIESKLGGAVQTMMDGAVAPVKGVVNFVTELSPTMAKIVNWIAIAGIKVSRNDCSSFTELGTMVSQLADELAAPAIEKIKELSQKASTWFSDVWKKFGLPVWDFIKKYIGDQWDMIKNLGHLIWDKTLPIRKLADSVWVKFKNWLGFGDEQDGIIQWFEAKVKHLWDKIKKKVEPFKKQLMIAGGVLLMLSPAGPFIAAGALFAGIITVANWIRVNIRSSKDIARLRIKFEKEILPSIINSVAGASSTLKQVLEGITGKLTLVVGSLGSLVSLVADGVLSFVQSALQWITDKFTEIADWASSKLNDLNSTLQKIFDGMTSFATDVMQFLGKVGEVIIDVMILPDLIKGLWKKIPTCIRDGIEDFLTNVILKNVPFFDDAVALVKYWNKIKAGAMDVIKTVFINGDLRGGVLKVFKLLLDVLAIPLELVVGIYNKALASYDEIVSKPKVIFGNIILAIKGGFNQFYENFLKNSVEALGNWVFSKVKGVKMPKEFSIQSVFGLVMDVLGFTEENIFFRIEKKTSKPFTEKLRKAYKGFQIAIKWIVDIFKDPKAAYEHAKAQLSEIKNTLFRSVGDWIAKSVIGVFITRMIAVLASTPFGEAIEAVIDAYKMIQTSIEYAEKILKTVDSVLDSILELAVGNIKNAVGTVEKGLTSSLEVAIAFTAKVIGVGDFPTKVKNIVNQDIRPSVDKAIDNVVELIINGVKGLKDFAGDAKDAVKGAAKNAFDWLKTKVAFKDENGKSHLVYLEKKGSKLTAMVASAPQTVASLIAEYELREKAAKDHAGDAKSENKESKNTITERIKNAKKENKNVEALSQRIAELDESMEKAIEKEKPGIQKQIDQGFNDLLKSNVNLSMHLSNMIKTGKNAPDYKNIYAIEGLVGRYGSSPTIDGRFERDHQPSGKMLKIAAEEQSAPALLKQIADTSVRNGFTIVLGRPRHKAGRTHGNKNKALSKKFETKLKSFLDKTKTIESRVLGIEEALQDELLNDAEAMIAVVESKNLKAKQWKDIDALPKTEYNDSQKMDLRQQIEDKVIISERVILSQRLTMKIPISKVD